MRKFVTATALSLTLTLGCIDADGDNASASQAGYVELDDQFEALREDFNQANGSVRLLFVVDPTCGGCLRGMDDVNKDLLAESRDPKLKTFVVHVPVIGATRENVVPSKKLIQNPNVTHYWNQSGEFGSQLSRAVGLKRDDANVYAWDVWLIYGPEAVWQGVAPPRPLLLMHQLRDMQGSKEFPQLDSEVFATRVRELLARLPPAK